MGASMRHHVSALPHRHAVLLLAACFTLAGCDDYPRVGPGPDDCPLWVTILQPRVSRLDIGATVTIRATDWVQTPCTPPDTRAAALRWSEWPPGVAGVDSLTGHVTALRPGLATINVSEPGWGYLGEADIGVFEPPSADTVVTEIRDVTDDSVLVTIEDANGALQRSRTVAAHNSACFVTPLSDSVRYSVVIYEPTRTDTSAAEWVVHAALEFTRSWYIFIGNSWNYSTNTLGPPYWALSGYNLDTGC